MPIDPKQICIGIVTALPKEFAAMKALLLDAAEFNVPGEGAGRRYLTGRIPAKNGGDHDVVLCMSGMGNNSAAVRGTLLLQHFPSVDSIVMTGIAGGVPNPGSSATHVRLRDIVVSNWNGVVQYDMSDLGEVYSNPRPPSAMLKEAVDFLEVGMIEGKFPWETSISSVLKQLKWKKPAAKTDVLHDSKDPTKLIEHPTDSQRRGTKPRVFSGTIASSNELLRRPDKRDELRDKHGARAVEMETSGIADATWNHGAGYFAVRGICDYCDPAKNYDWQEYAAAVAAAYTRALLESMPGQPIDEWEKTDDIISEYRKRLIGLTRSSDLRALMKLRDQADELPKTADVKELLRDVQSAIDQHQTVISADSWKPHPDLKVSIAHLPQPGKHFVGREDELAILDNAWLDPKTNIVEFVAFGGVGKSALVAEWLKRMQADEYRGAARVFGHSFYSQGSHEDAQASADSFLDQALRFFGDPDPTEGSPWDKGERLARLVRQQPTLLILDGVEPLQSPPTSGDAGQIRDPGLSALIRELATRIDGLCVISTRQRVQDIEWLDRTPDQSGPDKTGPVTTVSLESLSPESGSALLEKLKVKGSTEQRKEASREVRGHGLALTLLGNYLREAHAGDVEARHDIGLLDAALDDEQGGHARRMMQRLELWLSGRFKVRQAKDADAPFVPAEIKQSGRISLEILRLTGLFDRPITMGEFVALLKGGATDSGPIPGLTEEASDAGIPTLNQAIRNLESVNLLVRVSDDPIHFELEPWPAVEGSHPFLDAHPLVREYFGETLTKSDEGATGSASADSATATSDEESTGRASGTQLAEAVREAHRRLYEHLKQSAPELPDNLNDMMPLYHAVAHGCKAGLWQKAFYSIYDPRIQRGKQFFNIHTLGSFGAELATLANYFEGAWDRPVVEISDSLRAELTGQVAHGLRALGRLRECAQPQQFGLRLRIANKQWQFAAVKLSNLSELSLTLGDVSSAVRQGEQSVELADRSGDAYIRQLTRTTLAAALFCAGDSRLSLRGCEFIADWPGCLRRLALKGLG
jgi:nucleoside phosphorylase